MKDVVGWGGKGGGVITMSLEIGRRVLFLQRGSCTQSLFAQGPHRIPKSGQEAIRQGRKVDEDGQLGKREGGIRGGRERQRKAQLTIFLTSDRILLIAGFDVLRDALFAIFREMSIERGVMEIPDVACLKITAHTAPVLCTFALKTGRAESLHAVRVEERGIRC